jgi:hypothetical protein
MNIINASISGRKVVFENILEDIPGGVSLFTYRLDYTASTKKYLKAGAPVYVNLDARTAEVCKTTKSAVAIDATHLFVPAGHHFVVGNSITDFINNRIISAISASGTTHDIFTVPSGLVITADTVYAEAASGAASAYAASAASQACAFTPNGLIKDDVYIADGNADVSVVKMGTVREDALEYPLPSDFKIALRGGTSGTGTSLITVV